MLKTKLVEIGSDSEGVSEYENSNETSSESEGEETTKNNDFKKKRRQRRKKLEVKVDESVDDA